MELSNLKLIYSKRIRTILHLDMDSYFARVEQLDNPKLRGLPIGVIPKVQEGTTCPTKLQRRGVVAAASIEAKKFGLYSGIPTWKAKQLCPQIILVPARFRRYQELSRQVFAILENYSPLLEIFSIDEAFIDVSHLRQGYGGQAHISDPIFTALEIKARIREEIGDYLSCSIGIASNKLLAKLASGLEKPDGLTILTSKAQIQKTLAKIKLEELCGIGPRVLRRLNALGIYNASQLGNFEEDILIKEFGIYGKVLKKMGRGEDDSKIIPYFEMPAEKSMGHLYTLPADIYTLDEAKKVIYKLCEQVGERLRKKNLAGRTVNITLRFHDFTHFHKQYSLSRYINAGRDIYQAACSIISSNYRFNPDVSRLKHFRSVYQVTHRELKPIRMVGVSVSNLIHTRNKQPSLFLRDRKQERLSHHLDKINQKFGEFTIAPVPAFVTNLFYAPDGRTKRFYS